MLEDWQVRTRTLPRGGQAGRRDFPGDRLCEVGNVFWIGWEGAVLRAKLRAPQRTAALVRPAFRAEPEIVNFCLY